MARRFFPAGGAVGKRWTSDDAIQPDSPVIVGVVQDAKYVDVRGATPNMIYRLSGSTPVDVLGNLEIRTSGAPSALAPTIRQALSELEPALPVFDIVPLDQRVNRGLTNDRLIARLTSAFGIVALMLACLGLYGTISYGVARRISELGLRMALGADRSTVAWLVVREALIAGRHRRRARTPAGVCGGPQHPVAAARRRPGGSGVVLAGDGAAADRGRRRRLPARASRVAHRSDGGAALRVRLPARR